MKKIGIIGRGFVGSAIEFGFSPSTGCDAEVRVYDKDPSRSLNTLADTVNKSDFLFVSVPTPASTGGSINLDIVYSIMSEINEISNRDNIIILRSTVVPGTTETLQGRFPKLNIVFSPEFLTERSAKADFINQARFIIGGKEANTNKVANLFKWRFGKNIPTVETTFETAELIKYMNNCFFATKVSFMNEMRLISDACGANWDEAVEGFVRDGRVVHSHVAVPGPDGKRGFGGSCFPKDVQAMIGFAEEIGIVPTTLKGSWETNLKVRPEKDWEHK